jgi:hypothetical protein
MQRTVNLELAEFRALAHELSDFAANYLEELPHLRAYPESISGAEVELLFAGDPPLEGMGKAAFDLLPQVFQVPPRITAFFSGTSSDRVS